MPVQSNWLQVPQYRKGCSWHTKIKLCKYPSATVSTFSFSRSHESKKISELQTSVYQEHSPQIMVQEKGHQVQSYQELQHFHIPELNQNLERTAHHCLWKFLKSFLVDPSDLRLFCTDQWHFVATKKVTCHDKGLMLICPILRSHFICPETKTKSNVVPPK